MAEKAAERAAAEQAPPGRGSAVQARPEGEPDPGGGADA